eukprot:TRINITY_DN628_c0_g1_i1.p1 TRINITY_DN628_c0_g1~~TRINITY_DN628_c0_g1_i1.p1  ORF type:complete len:234 (+),score=31.10 TRINITY_DN628_c0_g1_i1:53-703(+)
MAAAGAHPCFHVLAFLALLALFFAPACADSKSVEVTVGSVIKLQHDRLKMRLHSHEVSYGSGSGQQSVTGFTGSDDSNGLWIVRCAIDKVCRQGDVIKSGSIIRLQHSRTRKWLHSHLHASPLTGNLEVSGYGSDEESDTGDHWRVEIESPKAGGVWMRDQKVRLQHVDTSGWLHSHDRKYGRPIAGQYEVCGMQRRTGDSLWLATEGVYFPPNNN